MHAAHGIHMDMVWYLSKTKAGNWTQKAESTVNKSIKNSLIVLEACIIVDGAKWLSHTVSEFVIAQQHIILPGNLLSEDGLQLRFCGSACTTWGEGPKIVSRWVFFLGNLNSDGLKR